MTAVLDAWAVLRLLEGAEPAAGKVSRLLGRERPIMSWVNLGEVRSVVRRLHGEAAAAEVVRDVRLHVEAELPDVELIVSASRIKADRPLAYADAFAAATALRHDADLWTGDPELLADGAPWRMRDLRS